MTHDEARATLRTLMHGTGYLKVPGGEFPPDDFRRFHAAHGSLVWDFVDAIAARETDRMHAAA